MTDPYPCIAGRASNDGVELCTGEQAEWEPIAVDYKSLFRLRGMGLSSVSSIRRQRKPFHILCIDPF